MYRIKGSQRKAFYLLLFFSLVWREVTAQTTTYHKAESFLFSFKENSDLFLADYGDNAYQLERMGQLLDASRNRLLKGDNHLLIVSHVDAYGYEEDAVVNEASLRASRIRAYLKTRFDIPHDSLFTSTVAAAIAIRYIYIMYTVRFRGLPISRSITVRAVIR